MAHYVQIPFNDEELAQINKEAEKEGLPLTLFIKNRVLTNTEFALRFTQLKERIEPIESGTVFTIRDVFNFEWLKISKGVHLALGRTFYNEVLRGTIKNVRIGNKNSANVQQYIKI